MLSWRWWLFLATFVGLHFWERRGRGRAVQTRITDVSSASVRATRLGVILCVFSVLLSDPNQWAYLGVGFLSGAVLGCVLAISARRRLSRLSSWADLSKYNERPWLSAILVPLFVLSLLLLISSHVISTGVPLALWSGGAAFLIAWGLLLRQDLKGLGRGARGAGSPPTEAAI